VTILGVDADQTEISLIGSKAAVMQNLANDQLTPKIFFAAKAAKFDQKGSKKFLRHQFSK